MSVDDVLAVLSKEFPNLVFKTHLVTQGYGAYRARFSHWWELAIDVTPAGCMAVLTAGNTVIACSPNEQGKTLQEVLSLIRTEWDEIAFQMSSMQ
jgi:hypothetical protein